MRHERGLPDRPCCRLDPQERGEEDNPSRLMRSRNPSTSSLYFAGASRNTRCPVSGITSARPFGIWAASAFASSALWPICGRSASGALGLSRRIVVVGAHDEQRRPRDKRDLVHDRLAVDQLRGGYEGAQPARIFGAALDVEACIDERRHLVRPAALANSWSRAACDSLRRVSLSSASMIFSVGVGGT